MTREDMLDCLHYELENLRVARGSDYSGVEAIEMAIKMLEAQELSNDSPKLDKENGDLQPTCNQLATDTISRQDEIFALCSECQCRRIPCANYPCGEVKTLLKQLPSAQPERKKGKWIRVEGMNERCSVCNQYFPVSYFKYRPFEINFCPNCGADMRGDNDDQSK